MNVLFIPCYVDGLPFTSASVRFRAQWPAKYWAEAEVYPNNVERLGSYDAYVFQKAYLTQWPREMAASLRARDKLLIFDMCDADWLRSEEHERRLLQVLDLFDFATCTTAPIRAYLARWIPAHVIPDRLDFAEYKIAPRPLRHPSAVWFGYSHNLGELDYIWPELREALHADDIPLTIISERLPPEWASRTWGESGQSPTWVLWTRDGAHAEIRKHTLALVPQRDRHKSRNREITAWALGAVPCETVQRFREMLDPIDWEREAAWGRDMVRREFDIHKSVEEWRALLAEYSARPARLSSLDHNTNGGDTA